MMQHGLGDRGARPAKPVVHGTFLLLQLPSTMQAQRGLHLPVVCCLSCSHCFAGLQNDQVGIEH